ncbi:MAG: 2OG-Fe(II) oxygenase, partial [Elsteraceae bacterium]
YYLHRIPKRFSGGDLLLFDEPSPDQVRSSMEFTRITPAENSLLLFPSVSLHAVTPVSLESEDRLDGRLTLNGWLHAAAEPGRGGTS